MKKTAILLFLLFHSFIVIAEDSVKAPFNGKLADSVLTVIYNRPDGSQFVRYSYSNTWFLLKESKIKKGLKFLHMLIQFDQ
jgi:hypothetical protein